MMKLLCISASNNLRQGIEETSSSMICKRIVKDVKKKLPFSDCSIIELKNYSPSPCINCVECLENRH